MGFVNSVEIVEKFFNYIKALENQLDSGDLEDLYNDQSFLSYVNFHYRERDSTSSLMQSIVGKLKDNKDHRHLLLQNRVSMNFSKENLRKNLNQINIRNGIIIYQSRDLNVGLEYKNIRYKEIFTVPGSLFPDKKQAEYLKNLHFVQA